MGRQVRGNKAQRLCLVCGNMFKSRHKYNRVCDACEVPRIILYKFKRSKHEPPLPPMLIDQKYG